jgi:adenine-specific DNA methylase
VLDPFCGSGTLLVEAAVLDRRSIGLDVDPLAVLVAQTKAHRYQIPRLTRSTELILKSLAPYRRSVQEYKRRRFTDLSERQYREEARRLQPWIPAIPNLFHWFRKYVIVDLARIRKVIEGTNIPQTHRLVFHTIFASIIRNSSNADPVPVSGLEVTSYMKKRDLRGRLVDPFTLFEYALTRGIDACDAFQNRVRRNGTVRVIHGDATQLEHHLPGEVNAVITSPPYHGAVDYYRRHTLEMFWLGQTNSQAERLDLLHSYVGRPRVPERHPFVANTILETALAKSWETKIRKVSVDRANAFKHYMVAMKKFFENLAGHVPTGAPVVLVVGHSTWNNARIPTTRLFTELAGSRFRLEEVLWYPVKNRYMSYKRHNKASIDKEYVLVLRRAAERQKSATGQRRGSLSRRRRKRSSRKA